MSFVGAQHWMIVMLMCFPHNLTFGSAIYRFPFHQTFLHSFSKDECYAFIMLVAIPSGVQDGLSCVGFVSACCCPSTLTYSKNMQVVISNFCCYLSEFTCLVQGLHIPESNPGLASCVEGTHLPVFTTDIHSIIFQ